MNMLRLSAMVALGFALLSANAMAQQNAPLPPPSNPGVLSVAPLSSALQSPLPPLGTGVTVPIPLPTPWLGLFSQADAAKQVRTSSHSRRRSVLWVPAPLVRCLTLRSRNVSGKSETRYVG